MNKLTTQLIAACTLITTPLTSFSHDGHSLPGLHWHATDAWGFVAVTAMVAVTIWLSRK